MSEIPYWLKRPKKEPATLPARWLSNLVRSKFFAAFIGFAALSAFWSHAKWGAMSPTDFPFSTWTSCAIEDFLSDKHPRPQIALVGSSLMLAPIGGVDADYLNKDIDGPRHHRSLYFENQFKTRTGQSVTTFNFALPGEMPSDAYLITRFLLKGEKKPDVLVYGVGPRDFLDNELVYPAATDPYQYLSRFGDLSDHISMIAPDWQPRLNFELGKLFYTYGHKLDLSTSFDRLVAEELTPHLPPCSAKDSLYRRRAIMPDYRPFEVNVDECMFRPFPPDHERKFGDNIAEYKKRYKQLKWDTYLTQMKFLAEILDIANERGIHPVIMAMPITDINRKMLSESAWDAYRHGVKVLATSKGATYIDVEGSGKFQLKDFGDTVHLHSGGGARLLELLAEQISNNNEVLTALSPAHSKASPAVAALKETHL